MYIDYKLIGQRIKQARTAKGWTQEELSEAVDVASGYISRVERGDKINLTRLAQMSFALDVTMEYLVAGVSSKSHNYLDKDLYEILITCNPKKQRLIYNMAKIVAESKFD